MMHKTYAAKLEERQIEALKRLSQETKVPRQSCCARRSISYWSVSRAIGSVWNLSNDSTNALRKIGKRWNASRGYEDKSLGVRQIAQWLKQRALPQLNLEAAL